MNIFLQIYSDSCEHVLRSFLLWTYIYILVQTCLQTDRQKKDRYTHTIPEKPSCQPTEVPVQQNMQPYNHLHTHVYKKVENGQLPVPKNYFETTSEIEIFVS